MEGKGRREGEVKRTNEGRKRWEGVEEGEEGGFEGEKRKGRAVGCRGRGDRVRGGEEDRRDGLMRRGKLGKERWMGEEEEEREPW